MIPLGVCSIAALTIVFERMAALRRARVLNPRLVERVEHFRGQEPVETVLQACVIEGGPLARIIEEVARVRDQDAAHQIETLNATGRREVEKLERGLVVLEIIANISPLIGLLGTVLGMVTVFDAITTQGLGNPQVLSEGISKALVTTVAGLCIAIPALAFHSYLSKLASTYAVDMHDIATAFAATLRETRRNSAAQSAGRR